MAERDELFSYYEAQAADYEDSYQGKGQAVPALAGQYPIDIAGMSALLSRFGYGDVVDLACGTGFWLTAYGRNCTSVTLVDQAEAVLARCRRRLQELDLQRVASVVQGDLFDVPLPWRGYDAAVLGFLLSHLTAPETGALFEKLRTILRPRAQVAVLDSAWSEERRPHRQREGFECRTLVDRRSFTIRKKYFDQAELEALLREQGFQAQSTYVGKVFIAAVAQLK